MRPARAKALKQSALDTLLPLQGVVCGWCSLPRATLRLPWAIRNLGLSARHTPHSIAHHPQDLFNIPHLTLNIQHSTINILKIFGEKPVSDFWVKQGAGQAKWGGMDRAGCRLRNE